MELSGPSPAIAGSIVRERVLESAGVVDRRRVRERWCARRTGRAPGLARLTASNEPPIIPASMRRGAAETMLVAALALGVFAIWLRLAWVSDDAYITLRTVENVIDGHGPVWNVGERVQTYTHPLWMWCLVAGRWLTGDSYFMTIGLSLALTGIGVLLVLRSSRPTTRCVLLLVIAGSRAFGDFATSGLETPLSTLLLLLLLRDDERDAPPLRLAVVAGLLVLTRMDLALLAAPLLLRRLWRAPRVAVLTQFAIGMSPLAAWCLWSWFYYGSPFPITAYAKLWSTGVDTSSLLAQGGRYLLHTVVHDPVTMATLLAGVVAGLLGAGRSAAVGMLLYCGYVMRVGGDFMAGRFFVPPFVVALALSARALRGRRPAVHGLVAAAAIALACVPSQPAWTRSPSEDCVVPPVVDGIADERLAYFWWSGLFSPKRDVQVAGRCSQQLRRQGRTRPVVMGCGMAGTIAFGAGDMFHVVDPWLCDPLLMRLPAYDPEVWRIGHFLRRYPDGYLATIAAGEPRFSHAGLQRYWADLHAVISGELWSSERLAALWRLTTGARAADLQEYVTESYRKPLRRTLPVAALQTQVEPGAFWFDDERIVSIGAAGIEVQMPAPTTATRLVVKVTPLVRYRFTFTAAGEQVGAADLIALTALGEAPREPDGDMLGFLQRLLGVSAQQVELPAGMPAFDACIVECEHEPWMHAAICAWHLAP